MTIVEMTPEDRDIAARIPGRFGDNLVCTSLDADARDSTRMMIWQGDRNALMRPVDSAKADMLYK